jgi:hypothetical protein
MYVQVGNAQFAVEQLTDKSLKDAYLLFKHIKPNVVKVAFELANKGGKKRSTKK